MILFDTLNRHKEAIVNNRLFVGQLSYSVDSDALGEFFGAAGQVTSARVMSHRDSGRSKGYGFVEMSSDTEANAAIEQLNGKELMGRAIVVAIARPPESRPSGDRAGGGRGGGGRFGGGGGGRGGGGRFGGGDRADRGNGGGGRSSGGRFGGGDRGDRGGGGRDSY